MKLIIKGRFVEAQASIKSLIRKTEFLEIKFGLELKNLHEDF